MASEAKNRNALRSKRMLAQALSELILEMPYEKITVSAITRRADLNRGTFYAHYDNELYRLLAAGETAPIFLAEMKRRITEPLVEHVVACHEDEAEARVVVVYLASGLVDTAFAWIRGEFGDIDTARLERIICDLCTSTLQKWA